MKRMETSTTILRASTPRPPVTLRTLRAYWKTIQARAVPQQNQTQALITPLTGRMMMSKWFYVSADLSDEQWRPDGDGMNVQALRYFHKKSSIREWVDDLILRV